MALTTVGKNFITQAIVGDSSPVLFDNTHAYIGVGDSSTAFAASQTDLQAAANKLRKGMESGFPARNNNQITFKASFAETEANFAWNEWAVFNASSNGVMLSRKVQSLGTKNGGVWVLNVIIDVDTV